MSYTKITFIQLAVSILVTGSEVKIGLGNESSIMYSIFW